MTTLEALRGINAYPVPAQTLTEIALTRDLTVSAEATKEVLSGKAYMLARADVLMWLSYAPDIAQGGQSYSFTDEQRRQFRAQAQAIYDEVEEEAAGPQMKYGYKGSRL